MFEALSILDIAVKLLKGANRIALTAGAFNGQSRRSLWRDPGSGSLVECSPRRSLVNSNSRYSLRQLRS